MVGGGAAAVRNANAAAAAASYRVTDDDCTNGRFRDEVRTGQGHLLYHDGARESTESHWKSTNGLPSLLRATLVRWCISNLAGPHLHWFSFRQAPKSVLAHLNSDADFKPSELSAIDEGHCSIYRGVAREEQWQVASADLP